MPSPTAVIRSEYRSPKSNPANLVGTEGHRNEGNIPAVYGSDKYLSTVPEVKVHGKPDAPMNMYGSPAQYNYGSVNHNPKAKGMPPILGRNLAFSWAGRTAHPDLTPATIDLDKRGQPNYLPTGIGALRYDNEGTGFAINQTYKDDDNDGAADMNNHQGGGFDRALQGKVTGVLR